MVIALIVIAVIVYLFFIKKEKVYVPGTETTPVVVDEFPEADAMGTTTPSDAPRNYQQYNLANEPEHQINGGDLGKISMSFAERFGSFSNQSNYGNFTDLKILMTDSMKAWADGYVSDLRTQPVSGAYYGITTKALTYEVKKFDEASGQAEVLITTQRRESTEEINGGEPYIQKLTLGLEKVNGTWLFARAYWEK